MYEVQHINLPIFGEYKGYGERIVLLIVTKPGLQNPRGIRKD